MTQPSAPILEARGVSKQYPGTLALDGVTFTLHAGRVSALIGENGAGKSTLVKILAGIDQPTNGSLFLDGAPIRIHSVRDADANGIGIIHQELNLCPNLTVSENIFLGREIRSRWGLLNRKQQLEKARKLLAQLEQPIDAESKVEELPLGQQQIVEIAKALARDVRILMMDEPTSALSAAEISILFKIIRDLKARGVAIVYISHRLEELLGISDTVSVLRDGRMVAESSASEVNPHWIVEQMTGRSESSAESTAAPIEGPELLKVESLSLSSSTGRSVLSDISLSLRAGEVLGIYGLMGAGRTEFLECLMGLRHAGQGRISLSGKQIDSLATAERISAGLAMVPEDRQTAGLVQCFSIRQNMTLSNLGRIASGPWLSPSKERLEVSQKISDLRIRTSAIDNNIGSLSGGNQQKVVLAKCLMTLPRVLLLDEPTRGVDVAAKREIYAIVRRIAASGIGVIFVSSELDEIRTVSNRILVFAKGRITGEFEAGQVTANRLTAAACSIPASAPERSDSHYAN
jgi:erythritol transport system ATP-binding protein